MTEHRVVLALRLAADVPLHLESALQTIQEARRTARAAGRVSGEVDACGKEVRVLARPRAAVAPRWYGSLAPLQLQPSRIASRVESSRPEESAALLSRTWK